MSTLANAGQIKVVAGRGGGLDASQLRVIVKAEDEKTLATATR